MTRLGTKRIISNNSDRALTLSPLPTRCPFCKEEHKDGITLKHHVRKMHPQAPY